MNSVKGNQHKQHLLQGCDSKVWFFMMCMSCTSMQKVKGPWGAQFQSQRKTQLVVALHVPNPSYVCVCLSISVCVCVSVYVCVGA